MMRTISEELRKVTKRSPMLRHRTGAIIVADEDIVSNGWSHVPRDGVFSQLRSLHAEAHAIVRARHRKIELQGARMYVMRLTASNKIGYCRPCLHCAISMEAAGIVMCCFTGYGPDAWEAIDIAHGIDSYDFKAYPIYEHNKNGA